MDYKQPVKRRWSVQLLALLAVALLLLALTPWWLERRREHSQDARILAAARRYGVDPSLIKALVWKESRFDPQARGKAGEIGLMQLMDLAAQEWAEAERCYPLPEEHLYDPTTNLCVGVWELGKMLRRYQKADDPLPYALADYNAGRGNVLKWSQGPAATNSAVFVEQIGFPGTRDYVLSILNRRRHYRADFPPLDGASSTR